jgi:hypothetical protein
MQKNECRDEASHEIRGAIRKMAAGSVCSSTRCSSARAARALRRRSTDPNLVSADGTLYGAIPGSGRPLRPAP